MDYGEKKAHRGRIDWLPGKCCAFPLNIYIYMCVFVYREIRFGVPTYTYIHGIYVRVMFPTCNFFLECNPRFSVAPFQ